MLKSSETATLSTAESVGSGRTAKALIIRADQFYRICVDNYIYAAQENLTEEDVEIRNRLFWSCYFWDKM